MRIARYEDIDAYLEIEFDAFYNKLGPLFGNRRDDAYKIMKGEMIDNLDTGRYLNAIEDDRLLGIIELITIENTKTFRKNFPLYLKHLGLIGAIRSFFLTFLDLPDIDANTLYISALAVGKDARRRGIGAAMLSYAEYIASSRGKSKLTLWVANENKTAYMLYRKMGFYQLIFRSSWIAEKYFGYRDWVFMCKDL